MKGYVITADATELKWENVDAKGEKPQAVVDQPRGKIPATAGAAFSRRRVQGASKKR